MTHNQQDTAFFYPSEPLLASEAPKALAGARRFHFAQARLYGAGLCFHRLVPIVVALGLGACSEGATPLDADSQATFTFGIGDESSTGLFDESGETAADEGFGAGMDDGETGDGADSPDPYCGDGVVDPGEQCDDGNELDTDACTNSCVPAMCGDGFVSPLLGEACDDGDDIDQDGCDADCQPSAFVSVSAGREHSCALNRRGEVWCWGANNNGQLGTGSLVAVGDDESPIELGFVDLGAPAIALASGARHNCALLDDQHTVRCWGAGNYGVLGQGDNLTIGDDEPASASMGFSFDDAVLKLALGREHSCALLEGGMVQCWGKSSPGALGVPGQLHIGDDEPANLGASVQLDGPVIDLSVDSHACAVIDGLTQDYLRCWGAQNEGELGLGVPSIVAVGDDEHPDEVLPVQLGIGVQVRAAAAGIDNSCAIVDQQVRCWGDGWSGTNANSTINDVGDDEHPIEAPSQVVVSGEYPVQVELGESNACVLLESGRVRCWGTLGNGLFGYTVSAEQIGDDEPASIASAHQIGDPSEGGRAVQLAVGDTHACVLTQRGTIRCWGENAVGQLGYGDTELRGDELGELEDLPDLPLLRP